MAWEFHPRSVSGLNSPLSSAPSCHSLRAWKPSDTHHSADGSSPKTLQLQASALFSLSARYGKVIRSLLQLASFVSVQVWGRSSLPEKSWERVPEIRLWNQGPVSQPEVWMCHLQLVTEAHLSLPRLLPFPSWTAHLQEVQSQRCFGSNMDISSVPPVFFPSLQNASLKNKGTQRLWCLWAPWTWGCRQEWSVCRPRPHMVRHYTHNHHSSLRYQSFFVRLWAS